MADSRKYDKILDALQQLLTEKSIQNISVSEIAKTAGIGKGSIYYYFPSKEAILDALVQRSYESPISTAKHLASQAEISPFTRMAMIFQACRLSSTALLKPESGIRIKEEASAQEIAFVHKKYVNHLVSELKPVLTEIIQQGIEAGLICFDNPSALAEIVLIVLAMKYDNSFLSSTPEESENTIKGLISLLERGTGVEPGTLNYLLAPKE